uniref:Uncharacterized protein n=1 Tax=Arundo donax TaxID=35708 RepID=A0A0A8YIL0_ARUDO
MKSCLKFKATKMKQPTKDKYHVMKLNLFAKSKPGCNRR